MEHSQSVSNLVKRIPVVALVVGAVIALHLLAIALPFVNQEGAFNSASSYFRFGDRRDVEAFFAVDANTLAVSAFGAALSWAVNIPAEYGARLLSIVSIGGFAAAIHSMSGRRSSWVFLTLVLANPLIWIFAGRGTADFLPTAFAALAISLFWRSGGWMGVLVASAIFATSVVMKYHAVLLLPLVALGPDGRQSTRWRVAITGVAAVATIAAVGLYNVAVFREFGFWITAPQWQTVHRLEAANVLDNFIRYGGYLGLLALPLSLQSALSNPSWRWPVAGMTAIAAIAGSFLGPSAGEMNFGPFDRWVGVGFSGSVLSGLFIVFLCSLSGSRTAWREIALSAAILLMIAVLSISRPAQRYLLLILPFYYLLLASKVEFKRWVAPTVIVSVMLIGLATFAQSKSTQQPAVGSAFGPNRQF